MLKKILLFIPVISSLNISNIIQNNQPIENEKISINKKYDLVEKEYQNTNCDSFIQETTYINGDCYYNNGYSYIVEDCNENNGYAIIKIYNSYNCKNNYMGAYPYILNICDNGYKSHCEKHKLTSTEILLIIIITVGCFCIISIIICICVCTFKKPQQINIVHSENRNNPEGNTNV